MTTFLSRFATEPLLAIDFSPKDVDVSSGILKGQTLHHCLFLSALPSSVTALGLERAGRQRELAPLWERRLLEQWFRCRASGGRGQHRVRPGAVDSTRALRLESSWESPRAV